MKRFTSAQEQLWDMLTSLPNAEAGEKAVAELTDEEVLDFWTWNDPEAAMNIRRARAGEHDDSLEEIAESLRETLLRDVVDEINYRAEQRRNPRGMREAHGADDVIRQLRDEAGEHGDMEQVELCDRALQGDKVAYAKCVRAIESAKAMSESHKDYDLRDNPEWAKKLGRAVSAPRRAKEKAAAAAAAQREKAAQRAAASKAAWESKKAATKAAWESKKAKARDYLAEVKRDFGEGFRANPRDEHKIYVANLAAYNAGRLKGKWIEPSSDVEELQAQILDAIGGNPDHEWAFHDYDSFPDMGENPSLEDVAAMAEILEEHPYNVVEAAMKFADVRGGVDELKEWLDEGYGIYESEKDYVEQYVDDMGGPSALGEDTLNFHFDYESFGRDLLIDADEEERERYEGMSDEKIGMEYLDEHYGDKIPEHLADRYFDYDSFARDVFTEIASARTPEGLVVFSKR